MSKIFAYSLGMVHFIYFLSVSLLQMLWGNAVNPELCQEGKADQKQGK
jgi:hypothetical protein